MHLTFCKLKNAPIRRQAHKKRKASNCRQTYSNLSKSMLLSKIIAKNPLQK